MMESLTTDALAIQKTETTCYSEGPSIRATECVGPPCRVRPLVVDALERAPRVVLCPGS